MLKIFNPATIQKLSSVMTTAPAGFRYGFITNVFHDEAYQELARSYPPPEIFHYHGDGYKKVYEAMHYDSYRHHGCIHHLASLPLVWKELLREAASEEFIGLLQHTTGITFDSLRNFALLYGKKGCEIKPHLDQAARRLGAPGATRMVCMFYFASSPGVASGGTTLYDRDRQTIVFEVKNLFNSMFFFEQHPEAWHGYRLITDDIERKALNLTFSPEVTPLRLKTSLLHQLFCP